MHFEGLTAISSANHIDEIKEDSIPYIKDKFKYLVREIGDREAAVEVARKAFKNCLRLDSTGTWERHWADLQKVLLV